MMEVRGLSCGYNGRAILEDVNFKGGPGDIISILGPNGSGKSTLIRSILGLIKPLKGKISLDNEDIAPWTWRERGRKFAYIPQSFSATFQYRSMDIVLMGRTPYLNIISSPNKKDMEIAEKAMERLNILYLKEKIYSQLSGGERQLVKIAQAIAQQSEIIIMDEPTNNLDFANQVIMLKYLKEEARSGKMIIMATHLPEHAFIHGTKALLVKDGRVIEVDNPNKNLREDDLKKLYNIDLKIMEVEIGNQKVKVCLPVY